MYVYFVFINTHQKHPSMKANLPYSLLLLPLALLSATVGRSQTDSDQNPNYLVSEAKYSKMADSLNSLHGTTPQETYKAIDWMAARQERRDQRRAFRRELRLERARYGWYYNGYGYYYPGYGNYYPGYSNYYPVYSSNYYYHRYHYYSSYNRDYWNLVPLAATVGWLLSR